jgi:hypothetical protein
MKTWVATSVVALLGVGLLSAPAVQAEEFTDPARLAAAIDAAKAKANSSGITYTSGGITVQGNAGGTVWRTVDGDGYILHAKDASGWTLYVPNTEDSNPDSRVTFDLILQSLGKKVGGLQAVGPESEEEVLLNNPWSGLRGIQEATYTTDSAGRLTAVDAYGERLFEVKSWSGPEAKLPAANQIVTTADQARLQLMLPFVMYQRTEADSLYREAMADPRFKSQPVETLLKTLRANGWNPRPNTNGAVVEGVSASGLRWRATIAARGSKRIRGVKFAITTPAPAPPTSMRDPQESFIAIDMTSWGLGGLVNPILPSPTQESVLDWIAKGLGGTVQSRVPLVMEPESGGRASANLVTEGNGWRVNIARSIDGYCGNYVMTSAHKRPILTAPASPGDVTATGTCT